MRDTNRIILYGFIAWLIPFLVAIPFYSPSGELLTDRDLFKTIMILTGGITGAVLIVHLFSHIDVPYLYAGCLSGCIWLLINWALDILFLIPLNGLDISTYYYEIGFRYLMIPVMTIMSGYIAKNSLSRA
jgi:hypothetical protein